MVDKHGDVPIDRVARPARGDLDEIAAVHSRRPAARYERPLSEVARLNLAVNALAKQCALRQALIDASPDQLSVKDKDGAFVVANKALASDRGRENSGDMIGLTDFDVHAPEAAENSRAIERDIVRSGQPAIGRWNWLTTRLSDGGDAISSGVDNGLSNRRRLSGVEGS